MTSPRAALAVSIVALATDMLLYGIAVPVLPALASQTGAGTQAVGVLFAVYAGALLLATPVAGWLIDRVGLRVSMLAGLGGLAGATVLFAFADGYAILILARALQGAAAAVTWTSSFALLAKTYPPQARGRAMGIALSALGIGTLAGPPLGGWLFEHVSAQAVFLVAAAIAAGDGVLRAVLVRDDRHRSTELQVGYQRLLRDGPAVRLMAITALGAAVIAFLEPILPLHLARDLDDGAGTIGLVFGIAVLISSGVAPSVGGAADRLPNHAMIAAGTLAAAIGFGVLALSSSTALAAIALAVVASGGALVLVPTLRLVAELAERHDPPAYGPVYGLYSLGYATGLFSAPLLGGLIAGATSFAAAASIAAVGCALGAATIAGMRARSHAPEVAP